MTSVTWRGIQEVLSRRQFAADHLLCAILGAIVVIGCTPLASTTFSLKPDKLPELLPPKPRTPLHMVDIWTDTVLSQPGANAIRGFGGRIMFFEHPQEKPVLVDGTLTVYLFEDTGDEDSPTAPLCKYVFLPEHLRQHYSRSKLGPSYSVWLPVDELGGPRRRLMIISRFEDAQTGKVIVSRPVRKTLPGPPPPDQEQTDLSRKDRGSVPPESHRDASRSARRRGPSPDDNQLGASKSSPPPVESKRQIVTSTIDIPPDVAAKIFGLQTQQEGWIRSPLPEPNLEGNAGAEEANPWSKAPSEMVEESTQQRGCHTPNNAGTHLRSEISSDSAVPARPSHQEALGDQPGEPLSACRPRHLPPVQRGPVVVPNFSPGRTQPHPVVWPSRPPISPQFSVPGLSEEFPEAVLPTTPREIRDRPERR